MKKMLMSLALVLGLVVSFLPNSASAVGFDYNLDSYEHWGTSPVTTGYPYLIFTINQTSGESFVDVQRLSNGSWVTLSGGLSKVIYGAEKIDIKVPVYSSSTQYRVFVKTGAFGWNTVGHVGYKGSW